MANFMNNSGNSTPNGATAPTNPVNDPQKHYGRSHNTFNESYPHITTQRYADIEPFFTFRAESQDRNITLHSTHKIKAFSFKSPVMGDVYMNKDYFAVPYYAIQPRTWELIYTKPAQGDDIPQDAHSTMKVMKFAQSILSALKAIHDGYDSTAMETRAIECSIKCVLMLESIFSQGSLLSKLGCKFANSFVYYSSDSSISTSFEYGLSFDHYFETRFIPSLFPILFNPNGSNTLQIAFRFPSSANPTRQYYVSGAVDSSSGFQAGKYAVSLRRLLELIRQNPDFNVSSVYNGDSEVVLRVENYLEQFNMMSAGQYDCIGVPSLRNINVDSYINVDIVAAYQLICHNFYVNDHVDFVYTSKMYLQTLETLIRETIGFGSTFSYNGDDVMYDAFSANYLDSLETVLGELDILDTDTVVPFYALYLVFDAIFSHRQSLRYGDYFTGGKPLPLAVGDIDTPVTDNSVNTIDLSRNILVQRYYNAVNRSGSRIDDYLSNIMGGKALSDRTEPKFIAHTSVKIDGYESAATSYGDGQGNVITNISTKGGDFAFTLNIDDPCIILGLSSFTMQRIYSKVTDRFFFHRDRFDKFNPFMQYVGDQAIYQAELVSAGLFADDDVDTGAVSDAFAYTPRHMEYKQRVGVASGGVVDFLPSWSFITDNLETGLDEHDETVITPSYIRSKNTEFDRFYQSLAYYGLAAYFHFIIFYDNECRASRAMEFSPSVL